jgi:sporulation protein YlmC with PRC-barrel domain
MLNRILAGAIALTAAANLAYAQGTPPATKGKAPPPAASPTTPTTAPGIRTADSATLAVKFVTVRSADLMSSKLLGINVYNNQNETLGEIEDFVIENGHTITGVVISVGGFLGIGESYVVVDPSTLVINQRDGDWRAFINTSKDSLKNAPKFTYTKDK